MFARRVIAPAVAPVSVSDAEEQLKVAQGEETALITRAIGAATGLAEAYLHRALIQQTWELRLDRFPMGAIELSPAPLRSIVSVAYIDPDGASQTVAAEDYEIMEWYEPGRLRLVDEAAAWPEARSRDGDVTIRYLVGYPDDEGSPPDYTANIPEEIKQAILLLTGHYLEHREQTTPITANSIPFGFYALLDPYRLWG